MPTPSLRQVIGVPDSTASVEDSVLIVIDAQDEYIYGQLPAVDYAEVNIAISGLLEKYRKRNGQVVHVVHNTGSDETPRSEERRVGKSVDLGGRRTMKKNAK